MSIVLERVLQTSDGKRFNRKNKTDSREGWRLHELHQRSSATDSTITSALSQELVNLKVSNFTSSIIFLDEFDSKLEKFNELSINDPLPKKMTIGFLLTASHGISELQNVWATNEPSVRAKPLLLFLRIQNILTTICSTQSNWRHLSLIILQQERPIHRKRIICPRIHHLIQTFTRLLICPSIWEFKMWILFNTLWSAIS